MFPGLFDDRTAEQQQAMRGMGLLQAGLGTLAANRPGVGTGAAIGAGGQQGIQAMLGLGQMYQQQAAARAQQEMQEGLFGLRERGVNLQEQQYADQQAAAQAAAQAEAERRSQFGDWTQGFFGTPDEPGQIGGLFSEEQRQTPAFQQQLAAERMRLRDSDASYGSVGDSIERLSKAAGGGEDMTADMHNRRDRVAVRLQQYPGMSEREAWAIELGDMSIRTDPESGRMFLTDIATGEQRPLQGPGGAPSVPEGEPSIREGIRPSETVGVRGSAMRTINRLSDAIGSGTPFPETDEARLVLENIRNDTMFELAKALEGRVALQALEWIREGFTVNPSSILSGEESSKRHLETTRDWIVRAENTQRDIIENPYDYSAREVQQARSQARRLADLRSNYDVLLRGFDQADSVPNFGEMDDQQMGEVDVRNLSDAALEAFIEEQLRRRQ